jgi:ATP-dependent Clp protease ATP-binding subunit ClpC
MLVSVFERFTEQARQVVAAAQQEAQGLRHNYIGTEHILLGCFANTELGAGAALTALGLNADDMRERVTAIVRPGEELTSGQIPFTPRAKKVLELGLREAHSLGQEHIESLHLLLGLVRERDGVAMQVLHDSGVSSERISETAIAMIPAGETVDRAGDVAVQPARELRVSAGHGAAFTVTPDQAARRLLMAAAGRALRDGREKFGVEDLRAVIDEGPSAAETNSA